MMFGSVSEHFANLRQVKRCKTCVSGLNTLFRGTEVVKHPFYSIAPKMMFGTVSEHFTNLRQVKRCKTCVSGLNILFWGTEVMKHPFYSIGPKFMFGSVLEHFANLQQVKHVNLASNPECTFEGYRSCEASILLHWTQIDVWECFREFR
jgi:acid stress-induced BolA-like protein IbaG/YrbA